MPFVPVEFAGLTVTPYVNQAGRLAYSPQGPASGVACRGARSGPRQRAVQLGGQGHGGVSKGGAAGTAPSCRPGISPGQQPERGLHPMRDFTGEQIAQVDNPDPFASPVWRSPVHRTPEWVIWLVQLLRLPGPGGLVPDPPSAARRGGRARARSPGLRPAGRAWWPGRRRPWPCLATLRLWRPRLVRPAHHRPGPVPVAVVVLPAALAGGHDHQPASRRSTGAGSPCPVLGKVQAGPCADLVTVRLVSGQSPTGLRRPGRGAGARVRGLLLPDPHRPAGPGRAGTGPP